MEQFKSIVFTSPFGTAMTTRYDVFAAHLVATPRCYGLPMLQTLPSMQVCLADFATRGCMWFDGHTSGSVFATPIPTHEFFPRRRARSVPLDAFVIFGFYRAAREQTGRPGHFVACDLCVWKGRSLANVAYQTRETLLRQTLSALAETQPIRFLREHRLALPVWHPLPAGRRERERFMVRGHDLWMVAPGVAAWGCWCLQWWEG